MDRSVQLKAADSKGCLRLFSFAEALLQNRLP
jgi:hypothetical protein